MKKMKRAVICILCEVTTREKVLKKFECMRILENYLVLEWNTQMNK